MERIHFKTHITPNDIKVVEVINRSIVLYEVPRYALKDFLANEPLLCQAGVYFYCSEDGVLPEVYIGSGVPIKRRLEDGGLNRDFWDYVLVIVCQKEDSTFDKNTTLNIEGRFYENLEKSQKVKLHNKNSPPKIPLYRGAKYVIEDIMATILSLFKICRYTFLLPNTISLANVNKPLFTLTLGGVDAKMEVKGGSYVVLAGSTACKNDKVSISPKVKKERLHLKQTGTLIDHPNDRDLLIFTGNCPFSSPTTSAGVIYGGNCNAKVHWKFGDITFRDYFNK
ncbi:hypothetical protein HPT25_22620 [Bacillus sp. BRMEA1]|uniref:hypothetical protein n=1 Tax=Neobacillus endophyticus TaxID=2738405 RepID=UPI001565D1F1|nr:hypothetical protein [Neobacillus endophyticus]NRD80136.1 hypothetical protein [Neobacillus endophyticus]